MINPTNGLVSGNDYAALRQMSNSPSYYTSKALTTGEGIVQAGDTGGRALRVQFLKKLLETVSFDEDDAVAFKSLPTKKAYSNTFEWTQFAAYGGPGDGTIAETGASGQTQNSALYFGVAESNDSYTRLVKQIRYMAAYRLVGLPEQLVENVENPMQTSETGMVRELMGKANNLIYFGDGRQAITQWDGIVRQLTDWVSVNAGGAASGQYGHVEDQVILYDAGGNFLDKSLLLEIQSQSRKKFGRPSRLLQSIEGHADTVRSIFPEQREGEAYRGGVGVDVTKFVSRYGTLKLDFDPLLRANRPLAADGPASDGLPRDLSTNDANCLLWGATIPYSQCAPVNPGAGKFWANVALNIDTLPLAIAPAFPSGAGNQGNRMQSGTPAYYGVSLVASGLESAIWVFGAASAGTASGATSVTPTAGQIVQIDLLQTVIATIAGLVKSNTKIRIYKYTGAVQPVSISQFSFLCDSGIPGNATGSVAVSVWDNGMYIEGADNAFLLTEKKNGVDGVFKAQLLPLMKRKGLPELMMASPIGMLLFMALIVLVPRHHVWIRNIKRAVI